MPDLAEFQGTWRLSRRISDALGPPGTFDGTARFDPVQGGLDYVENGMLRIGPGVALRSERRYLWRQAGAGIEVLFVDGRPFHGFDPHLAGPAARHDCAPDLYLVQYDFSAWPEWTAQWQVSGPRKDYRMISQYQRQA